MIVIRGLERALVWHYVFGRGKLAQGLLVGKVKGHLSEMAVTMRKGEDRRFRLELAILRDHYFFQIF